MIDLPTPTDLRTPRLLQLTTGTRASPHNPRLSRAGFLWRQSSTYHPPFGPLPPLCALSLPSQLASSSPHPALCLLTLNFLITHTCFHPSRHRSSRSIIASLLLSTWALSFSSRIISLEQYFCGFVINAEVSWPTQKLWWWGLGIGTLSHPPSDVNVHRGGRSLALGTVGVPPPQSHVPWCRLYHSDCCQTHWLVLELKGCSKTCYEPPQPRRQINSWKKYFLWLLWLSILSLALSLSVFLIQVLWTEIFVPPHPEIHMLKP